MFRNSLKIENTSHCIDMCNSKLILVHTMMTILYKMCIYLVGLECTSHGSVSDLPIKFVTDNCMKVDGLVCTVLLHHTNTMS